MRDITLSDVTQEMLRGESDSLIDMLRSEYPRLDLRRGTVLRDLLVDADAAVGAMYRAQAAEQRDSSSLLKLAERSESGEDVDKSDIDAAMSNFNMESVGGTKARGYVRVVVGTGNDHTVLSGVRFKTLSDGISFVSTADVTASSGGGPFPQHAGMTPGSWWFLVPVEAEEDGSAGNIEQGTAMDSELAIADFVSASAYATFSGGSDMETIGSVVSRIKSSLASRSLTTRSSVEAVLRDRFDGTDNPIVAVSVCGYGNPAQLRDKHNLFGVAVGGRADVYVRNFTDLPVYRLDAVVGELVSSEDGSATYSMSVGHSDVPGMAYVHSVSDRETRSLSSYVHSDTWSASEDDVGWHDFDLSSGQTEAANTVWRDLRMSVSGVPFDGSASDGAGTGAGDRMFSVEIVALPAAREIQDALDDGTVRNVAADYVVRCPMVVNVSVSAVARCLPSTPFDEKAAVDAICAYINGTGFPGRLTRSEISSVLMGMGARSVDLYDESEMLHGYVYDANGVRHDMSGDALDVSLVEAPGAMLTADTCVFVAERRNVSVKVVRVEDRP